MSGLEEPEIDAEEFSDAVREKARRLVSGGAVRRDRTYEGVFWVRSSTADGKDEYRVELRYGFQSCSCRYGLNRGLGRSRCSHVLASSLFADIPI